MKKSIFFWATCWSVLALLFLPFPFVFFPKTGIGLSQFIFPLNKLICSLFGVSIQNSFLVSDSLAFYSTGMILLVLSGLITVLIHWKAKNQLQKVQNGLFFFLILFLSYFLIHYGLDKLFGVQFYTPASNTLHTPVGQLGKDILFWTTMGTSSFYNLFMAIAEILTGILLLFNRTRFLGLMIGFGILLNIFAINIGFDITVKYLSGLLLFACSVCLYFYDSKLKFLLSGKYIEKATPFISQKWILLLFIPLLIDLCVCYWSVQVKDSGQSYVVESVNGNSQLINATEIARIHFHPEGYFITESNKQEFTSYPLSNGGNSVIVDKQPIPFSIEENQLIWKEREHEVVWSIREIGLEKMELKQDETNWYFERFVSR